jgi:cell division protease FtsH
MVMEYGMSDALGLPTYGSGSGSPFLGREMSVFGNSRDYSEESAKAIDEVVRRILGDNYERALAIIRENRDKMVNLAQALIKVETLDREAFEKLMNEPEVDTSLLEEVAVTEASL